MEAVARTQPRVKQPVQHYVISLNERESQTVSDEQLIRAAEDALDRVARSANPCASSRSSSSSSPCIMIYFTAFSSAATDVRRSPRCFLMRPTISNGPSFCQRPPRCRRLSRRSSRWLSRTRSSTRVCRLRPRSRPPHGRPCPEFQVASPPVSSMGSRRASRNVLRSTATVPV